MDMEKNTPLRRVVGIGNALLDVLAPIPDDRFLADVGLEKGGMKLVDEEGYRLLFERLSSLSPEKAGGGSAHNTIMALSRLGVPAAFIGKTGTDDEGHLLRENYRRDGIQPLLFASQELSTGVASTFVSPDGQRTFGTYLGAAGSLRREDLLSLSLEGYDLLYIEGYLTQDHEMIDYIASRAKSEGLSVALDLASYNIVEADRDFFTFLVREKVDIVFANEDEARALTGEGDASRACRALARMCTTAIVKAGAQGAFSCQGETLSFVPSRKVDRVVDTTAAGDFFAGGYLWARTRGLGEEACLRAGHIVASRVIGVYGTALMENDWLSLRKDMDALLEETAGENGLAQSVSFVRP